MEYSVWMKQDVHYLFLILKYFISLVDYFCTVCMYKKEDTPP